MDYPKLNSELASVVVLNKEVEAGYSPPCGICNAWTWYGLYHGSLVRRAVESWPAYSGDSLYPVPVEIDGELVDPDYGYETALGSGTLWDGQQGFLRRSLLRHCIDQAVLESGIY